MEKAYAITTNGRPGPCWLDIPMNIQSTQVNEADLVSYRPEKSAIPNLDVCQIEEIVNGLEGAKRPVILLGNGIRLAHAEHLISKLVEMLHIPTLVSWAGIDIIDSYHPLVYGRAGTYGQRCANLVVQNCDFLLAIGTRMAIPQVGYDISEFARDAQIAIVDIDKYELAKYPERTNFAVHADAKEFIEALLKQATNFSTNYNEWIAKCNEYREKYPWVSEWEHPDEDRFINSYRFMDKLNSYLKPNQLITTDMGTALLSGHQVLKLKQGQRLITSTGLGEMGYGLPAAIGASFAKNKGEVLCLNCDGGMMMNLQELQTVVHNQLPIKIVIFNNDGYLMIKHTQKALFEGRNTGTDKASGVSCPDYSALGTAFNIPTFQIRTWEDFETVIPLFQSIEGPAICEVFMHPRQLFVPKLSLAIQKDGSLISPPLEDLSPFISKQQLEEAMLVDIHPKSLQIER
jgi:acetolactate synthase-1/2/3 large subunit